MKNYILLVLMIVTINLNAQIRNVKVNGPSNGFPPEEVTIAINLKNPGFLAAAANLNYSYSSSDGGLTWTQSLINSTLGVYGDPCVIYDALGYLYYAHLSNPIIGNWVDRIVVQRSTDNGLTWNDGAGIGLRPPPANQDKEWLAVDTNSPLFKNYLYVAWTDFDKYGSTNPEDISRIVLSASSDHGITWSMPARVSDISGNCLDSDSTVEGAVPAIGPDGEVYLSWAGPLGLLFDRSLDGGKTFGKDIFVDSIPGGWDFNIPGIFRSNGFPVTACDTSHSPYRGNIYLNWSDQRNGTSNTDIFFSKSTDKGLTWSKTKIVNDDNSNAQQFFNWMTIDQTTGIIYICFYDRRNNAGLATDFYVARSDDGGDTFQNIKVSESSFTPADSVFFGDYTNIAAYRGKIYPIWMRMDNGILSVMTALLTDSSFDPTSVLESSINKNLSFRLEQNYPNPFNPVTTIDYFLPYSTHITLELFDVLGNKIKTLVNEIKPEGLNEINFYAEALISGVYFYKLTADRFISTKKLILIK